MAGAVFQCPQDGWVIIKNTPIIEDIANEVNSKEEVYVVLHLSILRPSTRTTMPACSRNAAYLAGFAVGY